ncbi:Qat anti-phage system QueC-like protein QatC [Faecalispora anaeroviscerum]|uniref:Qat anti-phage system QueC-like protein QatC n=1 Tax=Faecalispora anaeroviscerum TaxID=2991836 RepID=UPI0024B8BAEB|nr:Qat anti-phage system QueC-like protein QatC [Faecalispora anaeroviscerum]
MRIWVNKNNSEIPDVNYMDAYVFSLNRKGYSTIYTNLADTWLRLGALSIQPIYEDLFIIAISIFAIDKRVARSHFKDCWTRQIDVSIPVIEIEKWKSVEKLWNKTLNFLTGDSWNLSFRKTENQYGLRTHPSRIKLDVSKCNVVCLFSGGLDSFCGAISLLEKGNSPCLIGHNEYPKLRAKQENLAAMFREEYKNQTAEFLSFTANSRAPVNATGKLDGAENTSRGRSLLFLCGALTVASIMGKDIPVYIPENGFIGLNIPLTDSRKGSCSTRTTHPYFLKCFKEILIAAGINNPVLNFFAFKTKREIVDMVKGTIAFNRGFADTISCSHPCNRGLNKYGVREYPLNCGYCFPCLIRKSSLLDVDTSHERYWSKNISLDFLKRFSQGDIVNDASAVISSIYRYQNQNDNEIKRLIKCTGQLSTNEVESFIRVYRKTMEDLIELFSTDPEMKEYIGL